MSKINISELEALRAKMTGGDWEIDEDSNDQLNIYARNQDTATDWIALFPHQCLKSIEEQQQRNADGWLAEHNAIPALIALARADMALQAAEAESCAAYEAWKVHRAHGMVEDHRLVSARREVARCKADLNAARAAVTL